MRSRDVDARRAAARLTTAMARGAGGPRSAGGWLPPAPAADPARRGAARDAHRRGVDLEADVLAALAADLARGPAAGGPRHRRDGAGGDQSGDTPGGQVGPDDGVGPDGEGGSDGEGGPGVGGTARSQGPAPARARWAVTAAAALALLVISAVVTLLWGVRTAAGAPGLPVPDRPGPSVGTAAPTSASGPATTGGAATAGPGAAASGLDPSGVTAGARVAGTPAAEAGGQDAAAPSQGAGPSPAAGTDPEQAAARLPAGEVVVHVAGRVRRPGIARLPAGARVADALAEVGGATSDADLTRVNLARPLLDGEQVLVPRPGDELPRPVPAAGTAEVPPGSPLPPGAGLPAAAAATASGSPGAAAGAAAGAGALVDLNTATAAELDALPGLGPVLSGRIVELRDQLGRFSSVEELGEVSGIGEVLLDRLRPLVRV